MKKIDKTKAELFKELEETKKVVQELNLCQAEFEKSRERYEKLLDSSPDAMIFINTLNEIVIVNAQFEKIFGYSQEEILGKKIGGKKSKNPDPEVGFKPISLIPFTA